MELFAWCDYCGYDLLWAGDPVCERCEKRFCRRCEKRHLADCLLAAPDKLGPVDGPPAAP